jgi:hypothetical protein
MDIGKRKKGILSRCNHQSKEQKASQLVFRNGSSFLVAVDAVSMHFVNEHHFSHPTKVRGYTRAVP